MAKHVHLHLHDSGTSEGAKKAAQTRKAHGSGAAYHQEQADYHNRMARTSVSGSSESQAHYAAETAHRKAAKDPSHAAAAHAATAKVAEAGKHFQKQGMYSSTPSAMHWQRGLQGIPKGYNPRAGGYADAIVHDPKTGQFSSGGGSSGGGAKGEQHHPTHPLPDKPGAQAVYDHPEEGMSSTVEKRKDGSYYGQNEKYDFEAPNANAMREKLKKWGTKHVGWE